MGNAHFLKAVLPNAFPCRMLRCMSISRSLRFGALLLSVIFIGWGCASPEGSSSQGTVSFSRVQPFFERNCVHCHGEARLPKMLAFTDSAALGRLIGSGTRAGYILPGNAAGSRLYQVVAAADTQPGAMPPTGHAVSAADLALLKKWIDGGAALPPGGKVVVLQPRGEAPRSR